MNIQKISAIVLLVVLIITMIVVYGMLYYSNKDLAFPPKINKCPDKMTYDTVNGSCGDGVTAYETGGDVCEEIKAGRLATDKGNWDGITNADCD